MKHHGNDSVLAKAIGRDIKGKVSLAIYAVAIPLAFVNEWVSVACYVAVALIWFMPDPRIESVLTKSSINDPKG